MYVLILGPSSSVSIVTRLWTGWSRVRLLAGARCLSCLQNSHTDCGGNTVFYLGAGGTRGLFPQGGGGCGTQLATHLHLVPSWRKSGAVLLLPICLNAMDRDSFTFTFEELKYTKSKFWYISVLVPFIHTLQYRSKLFQCWSVFSDSVSQTSTVRWQSSGHEA